MGAIPRFMCPKMKRFAVKFRRFLKFSPCKLYKKSFGRIFPIYASKNEAVCRGAQTHFGSSLPANFTEKVCASKNKAVCREIQTDSASSIPPIFTEKVVGAIPRYVCPETNLFPVKFRRILKVFCLQVLQKSSGRNSTIFVLKNKIVCCEIQTHVGRSCFARFMKNIQGALSRFVRPKMKLFAMMFRRISDVLRL